MSVRIIKEEGAQLLMHRYGRGFGKHLETKEGLTRLRQWPTIPRSECLQWWAGGVEEHIQIRNAEDGNILPVFIWLHMVSPLRPGPASALILPFLQRKLEDNPSQQMQA